MQISRPVNDRWTRSRDVTSGKLGIFPRRGNFVSHSLTPAWESLASLHLCWDHRTRIANGRVFFSFCNYSDIYWTVYVVLIRRMHKNGAAFCYALVEPIKTQQFPSFPALDTRHRQTLTWDPRTHTFRVLSGSATSDHRLSHAEVLRHRVHSSCHCRKVFSVQLNFRRLTRVGAA